MFLFFTEPQKGHRFIVAAPLSPANVPLSTPLSAWPATWLWLGSGILARRRQAGSLFIHDLSGALEQPYGKGAQ